MGRRVSVLGLVAAGVSALGGCATERGPDSVTRAMDANQAAFASRDDLNSARFLVEMADARMMDTLESQVEAERGEHDEVREYARQMIQDQTMLLAEIQALAEAKGVTLPDRISNSKADGLDGLRGQTGDAVDSCYLRMIRIDHRRDVRAFRRATEFTDPNVRAFALLYLPMIEKHLRGAELLIKRY